MVMAPAISFFPTCSCIAAPTPRSAGITAKAESPPLRAAEINILRLRRWCMAMSFMPFFPPEQELRQSKGRRKVLGLGLGRDHLVLATAGKISQRLAALRVELGARV